MTSETVFVIKQTDSPLDLLIAVNRPITTLLRITHLQFAAEVLIWKKNYTDVHNKDVKYNCEAMQT